MLRLLPRRAWLAATTAAASVLALSQGTARADDPGSIPADPPQHFINFDFAVPGNFSTYTYTVKVGTRLATDYIFYAHYMYAKKDGEGFYSGIQPHPNGKAGVRFSFFGVGATPLRSNCHKGADDEDGVTCGIDDLKYVTGRKYTITATKTNTTSGRVYTGTIKDLTTGKVRTIGAWRLPKTFSGFKDSANAFIEKFDAIRTCADIPAVTVSYTGVKADTQRLKFRAYRHKATKEPGEDIYTCANVSNYTVTTPATGSYTVRSHPARH
ncbi:hypothetical protein HZZ00_18165 [Streptomyces sp. NEAU-sy36]|uniref:DUF3472 domain-containing protein n=1 Tax=unclassified Streptomyces TaxID=2593676 RepID=UPI0015D5A170|nr:MULTISPECIES: hypothetical protein [unclassified Streptomyces]QLJ02754.1 hypothetical protein HZZ00_18165 [Streptomyces sp. NEAU-sy36]